VTSREVPEGSKLNFQMALNINHRSEMFNRKTGGRQSGTDEKEAANKSVGCLRMVDDEGRVIRPALEER
jgi:hypothetical protein